MSETGYSLDKCCLEKSDGYVVKRKEGIFKCISIFFGLFQGSKEPSFLHWVEAECSATIISFASLVFERLCM